MSATTSSTLTTQDLLVRSRQYDVALIHEAMLRSCALSSLGNGLARCAALTVLDISRNALETLQGIEAVAATLTCLNAAENQLRDISALSSCTLLEKVFLQGNRLSTEEALRPLTALPLVTEICLKRTEQLDGDNSLVLDNPICARADDYANVCEKLFPTVRWVDGRFFREPAAANANVNGEDADVTACVQNMEAYAKEASTSIEKSCALLKD